MDLYGPPLPPGYIKPDEDLSDSEDSVPSTSSSTKLIGPQCPSFLPEREEPKAAMHLSSQNFSVLGSATSIGPKLPSYLRRNDEHDESSLEETCGPEPIQFEQEVNDINERMAEIEKRSEEMKKKLNNTTVPVKMAEREEWMVVPDTSRRNQLGAISRCLEPSKSLPSSKDRHTHRHSEKNKKTTEELKKYNKSRRSESLLDAHTKKLKKKEREKKSKHKEERKAFDRDEIAVRQFTKDQVNSVIDKAKYLNSRFKPGNNQYL